MLQNRDKEASRRIKYIAGFLLTIIIFALIIGIMCLINESSGTTEDGYINIQQTKEEIIEAALPSGASIIMNSGMSFNINTDSLTLSESEKLINLRPWNGSVKADELFKWLGYSDYENQRLEIMCYAIEKDNGSSDFICIFNDKEELLRATEITDNDLFTKIRMMLIQMHDVSEAQITSALYAATEDILITTFKMKGIGFEGCSITDWKENGNEATFVCTWMYPKNENEPDYTLLTDTTQQITDTSVIISYNMKAVIENNSVVIYQNTPNGWKIFDTYNS